MLLGSPFLQMMKWGHGELSDFLKVPVVTSGESRPGTHSRQASSVSRCEGLGVKG